MSGIMSPAQRNTAIARLKSAAERVISAYASVTKGKVGALRKATAALEAAWRAFPECERDEEVPRAGRVLEICARLEAEEAERLRREAL